MFFSVHLKNKHLKERFLKLIKTIVNILAQKVLDTSWFKIIYYIVPFMPFDLCSHLPNYYFLARVFAFSSLIKYCRSDAMLLTPRVSEMAHIYQDT